MDETMLIESFVQYLIDEKNSSENTRSSYVRDIRQFSSHIDGSLLSVDTLQLESYIGIQRDKGRSSATLARNVASLKNFYTYCVKRGYIQSSPADGLFAERSRPKPPQILSGREVDLLLDQPRCIDLKGYRDKAMLEVLYSCGMRVSELLSLRVSDIDFDHKCIQYSVADHQRVMPLTDSATKALQEYVLFIRKQLIRDFNEDVLFVNINGEPMSRQGFWKVIKQYQKQAGIEKNITPHTLRHSFAAHQLEKGLDKRSVQKIMGHSDLTSTNVYARMVDHQKPTKNSK